MRLRVRPPSAPLIASASVSGSVTGSRAAASLRASSATAAGDRGASGAHHLRGASRAGAGGRLRARRSRTRALAVEVLLCEPRAGARAGRDEPRAGGDERVAREIGPHVGRGAVGGLDVGAGVAEVANGAGGGARRADASRAPSRRARGRLPARRPGSSPAARSRSGCPARLESALATQPEGDGTLIPRPLSSQTKSSGTGRCWWAAWAVVLRAACAVAWFSEASPKLQTTTASPGQAARDAELARPVDRDRDADGARQVGGDRRGLRDDGQLVMAEDLVPAAGDRLVDRGGDALHHVGNAVAAGLPGPGEVEGAGAVVEQRGIGRAQRQGDGGVALVPRRADRVEAPALLLQPARRVSRSSCSRSAPARAPRRRSARRAERRSPRARAPRVPRGGAARADRGRRGSSASAAWRLSRRTQTGARRRSRALPPTRSPRRPRPRRAAGPRGRRRPRACRCRRSGASTGGSACSPPPRAASRAATASWREPQVARTSHGA